ncbi:hypothetical protein [Pandoraea horticolens]|uniref:hypothetical protein n=1 Tax=Pandoraea horticolens TaxID=2508298 RepID=UPI00123EE2E2|nr:hypothetical protein [Pandoraea horticolens]
MKSGPFLISLVGLFTSLTGLVLTFAVNGPSAIKNAEIFTEWYRTDQDLTGRWTNTSEGDIEPPAWSVSDENAVFLNMHAYGGEVSGEFVSTNVCAINSYSALNVGGRIRGNEVDAYLWDYIGGKKLILAGLHFRIDRGIHEMDVDVVRQVKGLLPASFRLGRRSSVYDDGQDHHPGDNTSDSERTQYRGRLCGVLPGTASMASARETD